MRGRSTLLLLVSLLFMSLGSIVLPATAQATCLTPLNDGQTLYGGWRNNCNVGISVVWNDQNYCSQNNRAKYPCAEYVGASSSVSAHTYGYVNWVECQSPGGSGDVLAVEQNWGQVYCSD